MQIISKALFSSIAFAVLAHGGMAKAQDQSNEPTSNFPIISAGEVKACLAAFKTITFHRQNFKPDGNGGETYSNNGVTYAIGDNRFGYSVTDGNSVEVCQHRIDAPSATIDQAQDSIRLFKVNADNTRLQSVVAAVKAAGSDILTHVASLVVKGDPMQLGNPNASGANSMLCFPSTENGTVNCTIKNGENVQPVDSMQELESAGFTHADYHRADTNLRQLLSGYQLFRAER